MIAELNGKDLKEAIVAYLTRYLYIRMEQLRKPVKTIGQERLGIQSRFLQSLYHQSYPVHYLYQMFGCCSVYNVGCHISTQV
jgi:hypothetical protein